MISIMIRSMEMKIAIIIFNPISHCHKERRFFTGVHSLFLLKYIILFSINEIYNKIHFKNKIQTKYSV